jgi:hypothetical protein
MEHRIALQSIPEHVNNFVFFRRAAFSSAAST